MKSDFQKVGDSKEPMIGEKCLVIGGFSSKELSKLQLKLSQSRLSDIPHVYVGRNHEELFVKDILQSENLFVVDELQHRFILMSGFSDKELQILLNGYKKWKLTKPLFATVTEVNLQWQLCDLIDELLSEAGAFK